MPRPRRSTVILTVGAALLVAVLVTALVLVQRVQADPFRTGAAQVARLAPDPGFAPPRAWTQGVTGEVTAYAEYEGFRAMSYPAFGQGEGAQRCMNIWQPDLLTESSNGSSYNGSVFLSACGAGVFPAAVSIQLREEMPEALHTDLPVGTSLQFVYDEALDEVVVFQG